MQYHIIFVCKYRKNLLADKNLSQLIKQLSLEICTKHGVTIKYMETDLDHIHYLMEFPPNISVSSLVRLVKSYTTYHVWRSDFSTVRKCYLISCETVPLALYTDVQAKGKSFCCRRFLKPFGLDVGSAKVLC